MARERVIKEIGSLEDAAKVEETVKTGYCDDIADNIGLWIAVEEDIADSYRRLSRKLDPRVARKLDELSKNSGETLETLRKLQKSLEALTEERSRRIHTLREMKES